MCMMPLPKHRQGKGGWMQGKVGLSLVKFAGSWIIQMPIMGIDHLHGQSVVMPRAPQKRRGAPGIAQQ